MEFSQETHFLISCFFCIALIALFKELKNTDYENKTKKIDPIFYINDLELYAKND